MILVEFCYILNLFRIDLLAIFAIDKGFKEKLIDLVQ